MSWGENDLYNTARKHPEAVGTAASGIMATRLVADLCQPGKTFVDFGAHIGSIIARVRSNSSQVRIEAVEAIPEKVEQLKSVFPGIKVHSCAVGDEEGQVSFFINLVSSGYSSMLKPNGSSSEEVREITVPLHKLDNIVKAGDVDVMKVDVEGAELEVFRGAEQLLASCKPTVMFESGPERDARCRQLHAYLLTQDYIIVLPHRLGHYDDGLSEEGFVESHHYPRRSTNYFAVHRSRRDEVRQRAHRLLAH